MKEVLTREGKEIARKLGNGVFYCGPWFGDDGETEFLGHTFNDSRIMTGSAFLAKNLQEAKERLVVCRIRFNKPLPTFQQLSAPKTP